MFFFPGPPAAGPRPIGTAVLRFFRPSPPPAPARPPPKPTRGPCASPSEPPRPPEKRKKPSFTAECFSPTSRGCRQSGKSDPAQNGGSARGSPVLTRKPPPPPAFKRGLFQGVFQPKTLGRESKTSPFPPRCPQSWWIFPFYLGAVKCLVGVGPTGLRLFPPPEPRAPQPNSVGGPGFAPC